MWVPVTQQGEDKARGRAEARARTERQEAGHGAEEMRRRGPAGRKTGPWGSAHRDGVERHLPQDLARLTELREKKLFVCKLHQRGDCGVTESSNHREKEEGHNEVPGFISGVLDPPHRQPPLQFLCKGCKRPSRLLTLGEGLQEGARALLVSCPVPFGTQYPTLF